MDSGNKKKAVIAGVIAALAIVSFLGASAWRYLTVVAPAEQQREADSANMPGSDPTADDGKATSANAEDNEAKQATASYSGPEAEVWSVLGNFTWRTAGGESYLSFADDGTVRSAAKGSNAAPAKKFELLAVEGDLADPAGCTAVIQVDEAYATMSILSAAAAGEDAFSSFPEGAYAISCPLFNDGAVFYKDPDNPVEIEYQQELPPALAEDKKAIDDALTAAVKSELPAVSKLSWEPYVSFSYDEEGNAYYMSSYVCNDAVETDVMSLFYPADKKVVVETSGSISSTTSSTDAATTPPADEKPTEKEDAASDDEAKADESIEADREGSE